MAVALYSSDHEELVRTLIKAGAEMHKVDG